MATEGNGASRLNQLIVGDTSKISSLVMGVITSPLPNISVRLDGESIDTPTQGIVVAEHLADHKREWRLSGSGSYQTYEIKSNLKAGDRVICNVANDGQLVYILDKAVV